MSWCKSGHARAGIVSNQDLRAWDKNRSLSSVAICDRTECLAKAIKHVAGETNETATYYPDDREPTA